jgi:hypothetical protein
MPKGQQKELALILIFFLSIALLFRYGINWTDDNGMLNIMGVGIALATAAFIAGAVRRKHTTLIADMDEKNGAIRVWMNRPIEMWKKTLTYEANGIKLENIDKAYVSVKNSNTVLNLHDKLTNATMIIPARIGQTPEVKTFFVDYFSTKEGKKVAEDIRKPILDFVQDNK